MGLILNEYYEYKDKYKGYIPQEVYKILGTAKDNRAEMLESTQEDRDKYFVEGLEGLSSAVFNLLHSGRGYYIINYAHDFSVNRKAAGFKTKEDIVHYAIWVIEDFLNSKNDRIKHLNKLKENSVGKSDDEMMKDIMIEEEKYDKSLIKIFPKGTYVCIRFKGVHKDAPPYYEKLIDYINKQGYEIIDDSLEMELTDPSLSLTDEEVIMELQILVKKS